MRKRSLRIVVGALLFLSVWLAVQVSWAASLFNGLPVLQQTGTPNALATLFPVVTITPSIAATRFILATSTSTPTLIPTITPGGPTLIPTTRPYIEHYLLARPFSDDKITYWARNYAYASTGGGQHRIHHGIDFPDPSGTPVQAVADGVVFYAAEDVPVLFGPQPNFYGNVVVIQHPFTDGLGQPVYTLYGHLSALLVVQGQTVHTGQVIGNVGATGIAEGSHLHLEVRVGNPNDYNAVRNPELWIKPFSGAGVLAGRIRDTYGNLLQGVQIQVRGKGAFYNGYSYADSFTKGDSVLGENFAIGDIADDDYTIYIDQPERGLSFHQQIHIHAGRTNWIEIVMAAQTSVG